MSRQTRNPRCIVIAGPNGSGKTTFAREYLTHVGSSAQGNRITNPSGNKSFSGFWQSDLDTVNATDRGDASISVAYGTDYVIQQFKTALTANRTVTINPGAEVKGSRLPIVRTGLGAFTLSLVATVGGTIGVIPDSTKGWVEAEFDGSQWVPVGSETMF